MEPGRLNVETLDSIHRYHKVTKRGERPKHD
jgi:hypothetical protein